MKEMLSVKELLALLIRKGRIIVCVTLVCAVCLGGVQAWRVTRSASSGVASQEEYEQALADYELEKAALETRLETKKNALSAQLEYNTESILMQLDAYNEAVTTIHFAVVPENDDENGYLSTVLMNRFVVSWGNLDLQELYKETSFADIPDKYLREVIEMSLTDGGSLQLFAYGKDTETSRSLVDTAYQWVQEYKSTLTETFGDFELLVLSNNSKLLKSDTLIEKQTNNINAVTDLKTEITNAEKDLNALDEPKQSASVSKAALLKSMLKWAILGAVAGCVLSAGVVFVLYLFTGKAENSHRMELGLQSVFLGSTAENGSVWNRLGNWVAGEKQWKNTEQRDAYLSENLRLKAGPDSRIAVVSTLDIDENNPAVQKIMTALQNCKKNPEFVGNATLNPKTAGALMKCESMVLVERIDASRWEHMTALKTTAEKQQKPLLGFVLI